MFSGCIWIWLCSLYMKIKILLLSYPFLKDYLRIHCAGWTVNKVDKLHSMSFLIFNGRISVLDTAENLDCIQEVQICLLLYQYKLNVFPLYQMDLPSYICKYSLTKKSGNVSKGLKWIFIACHPTFLLNYTRILWDLYPRRNIEMKDKELNFNWWNSSHDWNKIRQHQTL